MHQRANTALLAHAILFATPNTDPLRMLEPRVGDGTICHIFRARERCFEQEGGEGGGGGGGNDPPKTITIEEHQAQINKVVGQRIGEVNKKHADEMKAVNDRLAELSRMNEELQEKISNAGKTQAEIDKANAEKAAKALERERTENANKLAAAEKERDSWRTRYLDREVADQLGRGLDSAKVLGTARADAIMALKASSEIEYDDDGKVLSVTYEGVLYKSVADAAVAFLKNKPFFASNGGASGGGSKPPNTSGAPQGGRPLHEYSTDELLAMSAQQRARR